MAEMTAAAAAPSYLPPPLQLRDLKRVHPLWLKHRGDWLDIRNVTTGELSNKDVLARYVPRAEREYKQDYQKRLEMTEFVPESVVARQRIVGALFSQKPTRELKGKALKDWIGHVTRAGMSLQTIEEECLVPVALDYGAAHALIDRPQSSGAAIESLADLKSSGLFEPHVAVYTPLELRNWSLSADGTLDWILIVEEAAEAAGMAGKRVITRTYRWFDRKGWCVWKTQPGEGPKFPEDRWDPLSGEPLGLEEQADKAQERVVAGPVFGAHGAANVAEGRGRVPLASFIPDPIEELVGRSAIRNAVRLDIKTAMLESDRMWDLYVHAHPLLAVKSARALTEIGIGANSTLKLNPEGDEDAKYLQLPTESFQARERALADARLDIHRHTGADPMGVIQDAPGEASGVARAWSFSTSEGRHLGRVADRIESFEYAALGIAAAYMNEEPPAVGQIRWPDTFESDTPSTLIEQGIAFPQSVTSPTAQKLMQKRIARATLGDISPEDQTKIDREIDAAEARPLGSPSGGAALSSL